MNNFEQAIAGYIGEDNLKKIQAVKIGVAGAGGLGSNCAVNLVRSGFKNFIIVDFDKIEYSNLNRQFYFNDQIGKSKVESLEENLRKINSDIEVEGLIQRIEEESMRDMFKDCDVIVEAFDEAKYKQKIVSVFLDSDKLIVSASGLAGVGNSDEIKVRRIRKNLIMVGDLSSGVDKAPPLSPRVNIAAAKQADAILAYVLAGE